MPGSPDSKFSWLSRPGRERPPLAVHVSSQEEGWTTDDWTSQGNIALKKAATYELSNPSGTQRVQVAVRRIEKDSRICRVDITTTPFGQKRSSEPKTVYMDPEKMLFLREGESGPPFLAVRIKEWKVHYSERSNLNLRVSTKLIPIEDRPV